MVLHLLIFNQLWNTSLPFWLSAFHNTLIINSLTITSFITDVAKKLLSYLFIFAFLMYKYIKGNEQKITASAIMLTSKPFRLMFAWKTVIAIQYVAKAMIAPIINIKTITKNVFRAFFIGRISNLNTTIPTNLFQRRWQSMISLNIKRISLHRWTGGKRRNGRLGCLQGWKGHPWIFQSRRPWRPGTSCRWSRRQGRWRVGIFRYCCEPCGNAREEGRRHGSCSRWDIHRTVRSGEPFRSGNLWSGRIREYRTHGLSKYL